MCIISPYLGRPFQLGCGDEQIFIIVVHIHSHNLCGCKLIEQYAFIGRRHPLNFTTTNSLADALDDLSLGDLGAVDS